MKTQYPKTPIIGLTATATANVLVDIQKMLNMEGCLVLRDSFYRPNLRYSVRDSSTKEKLGDVADIINTKFLGQSGIIYCLTVKDCEDVSKQLTEDYGISCASYHARLEPEDRTKTQRRWSQNKISVIVATVAFGMGIDKTDCRFVIHFSLPKSIEGYYQESGRAGRDGLDAECILFYSFPDSFIASSMMMTERNGTKNVYNMLSYALDQVSCRKKLIAIHFGDSCEAIEAGCNKCDNCEFAVNTTERRAINVDGTKLIGDILKILDHASSLETRMTALKLMDAWFNKGLPKLRTTSVAIPEVGRATCEKLVGRLIVDGYLKEDFHFTPYSTIGYIVPGSKSFANLPDLPKCPTYTFYQTSPSVSGPTKIRQNSKTTNASRKSFAKSSSKRKSRSSSADTSEDSSNQDQTYPVKKHHPRKSSKKAAHVIEIDSN